MTIRRFRRFRRNRRWTIAVLTLVFGQWNFAAMVLSQDPKKAHSNRLVDQTSPYLLQHAHNPVNWFPWDDDAFAKAKRENKPVFLSIGYSTCYWCHVMEVESFEDEEVAAVINELFVAIKVDREEHPDIDEQYMLATQLITKRGGWPNSVWLTPEGKPWMAGTYFPKKGFIQVLRQLADAWKNRRPEVEQQAEEIARATQRMSGPALVERIELSPKLNQHATEQLVARFDRMHGGFGGAPKFPPHGTLQLLIQQYRVTENELLLKPIAATLDAMWLGGIHDHIGGGFHRYSTDNEWLLPHFEKMLYDNAQLMRAYVDGYKITGEKRYRDAVADIDRWVQREMTSPTGAFYSALDSGEVGKEGEAYVWRTSRLTETLGSKDAALFASIYGFEQDGNYKEQASGKKNQTNIPHLKQPIETTSEQLKESEPELAQRLVQMRAKLLADRETWPQPRIDDKVLTSWNGLMIGSLAYAGRALNEPEYIESASKAADFIINNMTRDGVLLRTYRNDIAKINGYLDDYAYFVQGLLELYHATDDSRWLDQAIRLANVMLQEFQDQANGGFFFTTGAHDEMIVRSKHLSGGGNMPDPNGIAVQVLIELAQLTDNPVYLKSAKRTLESLSGIMAGQPHSQEHLLIATSQYVAMKESKTVDALCGELTKRVDPVSMRVGATQHTVHPGNTTTIKVMMDIDDGWHLYAENPASEFLEPSRVTVEANEQFVIGKTKSPSPESITDPILKQRIDIYAGQVEFEVPLTISPEAKLGKIPVTINIKTQACDKNRCLPPQSTKFELTLQISAPTTPEETLDR